MMNEQKFETSSTVTDYPKKNYKIDPTDASNNNFVDSMLDSTQSTIDKTFQPRNRAERRALDKATRRKKQKRQKMYIDNIREATTKLAYIDMIQKVRELNEKIKEEGEKENEATN